VLPEGLILKTEVRLLVGVAYPCAWMSQRQRLEKISEPVEIGTSGMLTRNQKDLSMSINCSFIVAECDNKFLFAYL